MGVIFEGKRYEMVRFRGVDLLRAREATGLSQEGLAERLRNAGWEKIGVWKVDQRRVSGMESAESCTIDVAGFSILCSALGLEEKITA